MPSINELSERLARLEEQVSAYKALVEERLIVLRRVMLGVSVILTGVVAWAAAQGFDLGGLVNALP